jgi:hypothetical protein
MLLAKQSTGHLPLQVPPFCTTIRGKVQISDLVSCFRTKTDHFASALGGRCRCTISEAPSRQLRHKRDRPLCVDLDHSPGHWMNTVDDFSVGPHTRNLPSDCYPWLLYDNGSLLFLALTKLLVIQPFGSMRTRDHPLESRQPCSDKKLRSIAPSLHVICKTYLSMGKSAVLHWPDHSTEPL